MTEEHRENKEINEVTRRLDEQFINEDGQTRYEGMTYEQGVMDALIWVKGNNQDQWPFIPERKIKRKKRVLPPGVVPK